MRDMQRYLDRAYSCLLGIKIINDEINKYNSPEKRAEVAEKYSEDLAILSRENADWIRLKSVRKYVQE